MAIQLQEFAKQVLFGTTIEEKLSFPREDIIDTQPGSPIATPRQLARPAHLALRENGARADPPSAAKLIDEKERGRLLHFFGNHELLATELMALALLKFPDAPKSFRRGLLETLKDEQIHTRIYMRRMEQCGVAFGELPLSDYFWKSVSSMEDPLDYVTRLSLTFEQANLDYSREYASIFREAGDASTAGILDRIYRDEIGHVGFGLRWFRRWKATGKTDWEAFRERLVFPLSPSRAKGNRFNGEGRSAAGLDPAFIQDLQIFSQSRGRTPSVLWFNPDAERCAAGGALRPLKARGRHLQNDLAFLPTYLARKGDILILPQQPTAGFLTQLHRCGFDLPEIVVADNPSPSSPCPAPTIERKLGELRPWAWSPDSVSYFRKLFPSLTRPVEPGTLWSPSLRSLYSKLWAADWGRGLAEDSAAPDWLAPTAVYGQEVERLDQLLEWRERFAAQGYPELVCKAPFGTAAHANRRLPAGEPIDIKLRAWLEQIWREQGALLVEPWLDRVFDFSVQCEMRPEGLRPIAFTRLLNNPRGQFQGIITNAFTQGLDERLRRFLMQRDRRQPRLYAWYQDTVLPRLAGPLAAAGFRGPLGIDAFVYRDPSGALRLKTVVEINPRVTMGRIAHEVAKRQAPRTAGLFQIVSRSQLRKLGASDFVGYVETLQEDHPPLLAPGETGSLLSGSIALVDPSQAQQFLALYHVRASAAELPIPT